MTVRHATSTPDTAGPARVMGPARPAPVPLVDSYAALARVFPDLRIRLTEPPEGRGWVSCAQLPGDPQLRARLLAAEARYGLSRYGEPLRPEVAAGFWLHRLAWPLGLFFTLPWFLERRVPLPAPGTLALRRAAGGGGPFELATRPPAFACLPQDPAAALPGARPVADEDALRAELRTAVAGQLAPVLAAFRRELRRGPRTLWGLATDELAEGLWFAAGLLGVEERAVVELAALLPGGTAPFTGAAAFHGAGGAPPRRAAARGRSRVSCCLYYTVRPTDACAGCPRTCA
ncbi:(2Fe-2S)-binding protein [Kitasatospora nipponensis]|uniref:(2Fe-2S)-binding protein n=1 Tax=Kitasatospora nipponensis TaxID=258049 RepID=A0ABN1WB26_9ACTN